ncbi:MAG: S8 family serine peptidase [Dokdonella sp.]
MNFVPAISRRPHHTLMWLAMAACLPGGASLAGELTPELRATYADRVQFDSGAPNEKFDSFIVYYRDDAAPDETGSEKARKTRSRIDMNIARVNQRLDRGARYERPLATGGHLLRLDGAKLQRDDAGAFMIEFAADPDVVSIEPNARAYANAVPSDPYYSSQWGLRETTGGINVESAWDVASGNGIVIAVIDTGKTTHPDLNAKYVAGYDFISDAASARDGNGRDADPTDRGDWTSAGDCSEGSGSSNSSWHGTHVTGIAAAITDNGVGVAGVAYAARVQPVRVLGRCGGSVADIAEGLIWASGGAVVGVPTNPTPARVLNLSLGGSGSCGTTYQNAINSARARNSIVVVAAGNENESSSLHRPGNCSGVVSVAATNRSGQRASYSNYGANIVISSPGGDSGTGNGIQSTVNAGTTVQTSPSYGYKSGTSMATPYVAGAVALMLGRNPALTPTQVEALLRNTARPFPSYCSGGCGPGIIDAYAAVRAATGTTISQYPFTVSLFGNGNGSVSSNPAGISCGTTCSRRFNSGTSVTLLATPTNGYAFAGWTGACSGSSTTCTVAMNQARTAFATFKIPVSALSNGSVRSGLAASSIPRMFSLNVPPGATNLSFQISGGSGDADLYVLRGTEPSKSVYECRPYQYGNTESCTFSAPVAGTYYVMLVAEPSFSGVTLRASYTTAPYGGPLLANGTSVNGLSAPTGGARYFRIVVPEGAADLRIATQGGSGDADLYIRRDAVPTTANFLCAPFRSGNDEPCVLTVASAGTYYIMLLAAEQFSGVSLVASHVAGKRLTINWSGAGAGSVAIKRATTGNVVANCTAFPCSLSTPPNVNFDLVAKASDGSHFSGWTASQCSSIIPQGNCRLLMTTPKNVTATFTMSTAGSPSLTINKSGSGSGIVEVRRLANGATYGICTSFPCRLGPLNATYDMIAKPATGSRFVGWAASQCDSISSQGNCRVLISRPVVLTAPFQPQ